MSNAKRTLIIDMPHLPPRELNPNTKLHWAVKYKAIQEAKEEIGWLAKAQWGTDEPMMKARVSYTFHAKDRRKRDLDNLLSACKAYQDGLIEVGVLFYDDAEHLEIGRVALKNDTADRTVILVEEL